MRIGIVGSMHSIDRMLKARDKLVAMGHDPFLNSFHEEFIGKKSEEIDRLKKEQTTHKDVIRAFWIALQNADAILVVNIDRYGIKNYIGGNTLMEIGFAHVLGLKVFLWNPIPDMPHIAAEVEAVRPTVIYGDITRIR